MTAIKSTVRKITDVKSADIAERDVKFFPGRPTSPDPSGWYSTLRDGSGNILDVIGPFDTKAEAYAAA